MLPKNSNFITRLVKWMCKNKKLDLIIDIYPLYDWEIDITDPDDIYKTENLFHYCCRHGFFEVIKTIYK